MSDTTRPAEMGHAPRRDPWPEMPEIRVLLSLRSHESRTRRRLALCDELCASLEVLYRTARALSASGLALNDTEVRNAVRRAPASVHTICSLIRDLAAALNSVTELVEPDLQAEIDPPPTSADSPVAPTVRRALHQALDEHTALRSWKDVAWLGLSADPRRRLAFRWAVGVDCLQKDPKRGYPALRPVVLLARRVADEALALLDPLTGPIAEERANAFAAIKKLRAQIEHVRSMVNRKCDTLESEMRSVQSAIIKAQSQTITLVRNLSTITNEPAEPGPNRPPDQ